MKKSVWERDNFIRVFSVILALVLWFYVGFQNPETETTIKNVMVEVKAPHNPNLDMVGMSIYRVDITVGGKKNVLRGATVSSVSAYIDASKVTEPGVYDFPVETTVNTPDMLIIRKSLSTIKIRFDNTIVKKVPVYVNVENKLAQTDYTYGAPKYSPQFVNVSGPKTEVDSIVSANVTCKLDKIANVVDQTFDYVFKNDAGETVESSVLSMDYDEVLVNIDILQKKKVPVILTFENAVKGWEDGLLTYTLNPLEMTIVGSIAALSEVNQIVVGPVDVNKLTGKDSFLLDISFPDGVRSADEINRVTAEVTLGAMQTKKLLIDEILLVNRKDNRTVTVDTLPLEVAVRGPAEYIDVITNDSVKATIDAGSLPDSAGKFTVPVTIDLGGNAYYIGVVGLVMTTVTTAP